MDHKMHEDRFTERENGGRGSNSSSDRSMKKLGIVFAALFVFLVIISIIVFSPPADVMHVNNTPMPEKTAKQEKSAAEPTPMPTLQPTPTPEPDPFAEQVICELNPAPEGTGKVDIVNPQPLILRFGKDVYITDGENVMPLPGASIVVTDNKVKKLNGYCTIDNHTLYYQADPDYLGAGKLMKVSTDCIQEPKVAIKKMSTAVFSDDGSRILYGPRINKYDEVDLYMFDGKKSKRIVRDAADGFYGLSPNGKNMYYYLSEANDDYTYNNNVLYKKLGGSKHKKIETFGLFVSVYDTAVIGNSGALFYWLPEGMVLDNITNYVHINNQKLDVGSNGVVLHAFNGNDELLTLGDGKLRSIENGKEKFKTRFGCVGAIRPEYTGGDPEYVPESLWVIEREVKKSYKVKYDQLTHDDRMPGIAKADAGSGDVNADITWMKYTFDGELFLKYRVANKWIETGISLSPDFKSGCFDTAGEYYWFVNSGGDLYRFSLERGTIQLVSQGVREVCAAGYHVYALTDDNMLYVIEDKEMRLLKEYVDGFLSPMGEVVFAKEYGMTEEAEKNLEELYQDALLWLDGVHGTDKAQITTSYRTAEQSKELAHDLSNRRSISRKIKIMASFFDFGFGYAADSSHDKSDRETAIRYLEDAVCDYEEYMGIES